MIARNPHLIARRHALRRLAAGLGSVGGGLPRLIAPGLGLTLAATARAQSSGSPATAGADLEAPASMPASAPGLQPVPPSAPEPTLASPAEPGAPGETQADRDERGQPYANRAQVLAFAQDLAERRHLPLEWIREALGQAVYQASVVRALLPAPVTTAKDWSVYRARFLDTVRIRRGLAFYRQHARTLYMTEVERGVPASIMLGILGVETLYGRQMGSYRVLDALCTLAFDFPSGRRDRSAFFKAELGELLLLAHREGKAPTDYRGSYAGAIGWPQFMPGSINAHAADGDGDGRVDLVSSPRDAIASVASFLVHHGWVRGMPTHYGIELPDDAQARATLLAPDILPSFEPREMLALGASLGASARAHEGKLALVELLNGAAPPSYVAGTQNFYALTRYNWSSYYAMAVIELGEVVAAVGSRLA